MRRGLLAVGLVIAVMAALVSVPAFLGLALGHNPPASDDPRASAGAASASPAAPLAPVSFQSGDGYRMTMPGGWTASSLDIVQEQLLLNVLRSSDPEVASLLDSILQATGGDISMVGGDIRGLAASGVPPNVSVITEPAGTETLSAAGARISAMLAAVEGVGGAVRQADASLGGITATKLDWALRQHTAGTQGAAPEVMLTTYVVIVRARVMLVTVGTDASTTSVNRPLLDGILNSFHFEESLGH